MNPEERNKATLLVIATLAVLGLCFFMVSSQLSRTAPSPVGVAAPVQVATKLPNANSVSPTKTQEGTVPNSPSGTVTGAASSPANTDAAVPPSSAGTNPFKKVISTDSSSGGGQPSAASTEQAINDKRRQKLNEIQGLTPGSGGQPPLANLPPATGGSFAPMRPDGTSDLNRVQGTIWTPSGAAVMVSYNGETLYLRAGDRFGDGIRVKKVAVGYAVFTKKKKAHRLEIGDSLLALF